MGPSHILWLRGEVPAGQKSANDGLLKGGRSSASDASVFGKLAAKQQLAHGLIFSCVHDNHEISQEEFESFEVLRDSSVLNVRSGNFIIANPVSVIIMDFLPLSGVGGIVFHNF